MPQGPFRGARPEVGPSGLDRTVLQESAEVVGHVLCRSVAIPDIPRNSLEHDRLQVAGDGRVPDARPSWLVECDLMKQLGTVAAVVGRMKGQQLVERRAERINVSAVIDNLAAGRGLLGAHVPQGSHDVAGHRQIRCRLASVPGRSR